VARIEAAQNRFASRRTTFTVRLPEVKVTLMASRDLPERLCRRILNLVVAAWAGAIFLVAEAP
jgi:hypothetical protein